MVTKIMGALFGVLPNNGVVHGVKWFAVGMLRTMGKVCRDHEEVTEDTAVNSVI